MRLLTILVMSATCLLSHVAHAAPGDLDTSFGGGDGWVSTGLLAEPTISYAQGAVKQSDGKLVVAGYSSNGTNYDFALVRYNSDGSLDTTFDGDGKVTTAIGSSDDYAYSVIQQSDGKLVAAGSANNGVALVRYNSDGSLDTTFNGTGKVTTAIGNGADPTRSLIQQSDGKLVAAGSAYNGVNRDFALVRYNSDGSLDTTFSGDGKVMTAIGSNAEYGRSVIQQSDGKLLVAGYANNGTNDDVALVRYNSDGSLDTTFDGDGKVTTAIGGGSDTANSVIQQADGKLVAAGNSNNGSNNDFALVRYNSNGTLDTTFNSTGKVTTAIGSSETANSVIQQADGKLIAVGVARVSVADDFALVRYNSDGTLDTTFSADGKVTTSIGTEDRAYSVFQQSDGTLVAAGYAQVDTYDFALVRYNSNGSLDTTFDSDGKVNTNIGRSNNTARSLIQQADGKLVVAGNARNGANDNFALARYNSDGSLDTTFDGDGKVTTANGSNTAHSLFQQSDGKLVAAGFTSNGAGDFGLVRYNSDGSLDTTFNGTGKVTTAIGSSSEYANSIIQQSDGKLVAAGDSYNGSNNDFALVRYNSDGSLDTTFNGTGKLTTAIGSSHENAYSIIQQADGRLVVVGTSYNGANFDFALVRYNSDGSLDTTFNGTGKVTTAIGSTDYAYSVIQQSDGKLVAAGYANNGANLDFALARYNSDGSLDSSFGSGGVVQTAIGAGGDEAYSLLQQADGKLVAVGYASNGTNNDVAIARYNSDGSLDTTFSGDGKLTFAPGAGADLARSAIQQADGKLAVAGYSNGMPTGQEFVVARFESGLPTTDTDSDGTINMIDLDDDNDTVPDVSDAFPLDAAESVDTDNDGTGNNADWDDDADGIPDGIDADPLSAATAAEITLPLDGENKGAVMSSELQRQ